MQIDIEMAARMAPGGMAVDGLPAEGGAERRFQRVVVAATVLATVAAVLLASCFAVMLGLS